MEKKVNYTPAIPRWTEKRKVGICCRVSTNDIEAYDPDQGERIIAPEYISDENSRLC